MIPDGSQGAQSKASRGSIEPDMKRQSALYFVLSSAVIGALALLPAGCGGPPVVGGGPLEPIRTPADSATKDLAAWLPGNYSNAAQAAADSTYFDVRLHIVPIWTDRADGPWMYVEQAMADAQHEPYRQRIYRLISLPNNQAEIVIYELPGAPLAWAGAWRNPERFNALDPGIITVRPGCSMVLGYQGAGHISGNTKGADCGNALRDAAYATTDVTVTPTELNSWDRGYDATGNQVWGAVKGGYRFIKESPAVNTTPQPEQPMGDEAPITAPTPEPHR